MTRDEIVGTVLEALCAIAPEAEDADLPPDADIRDELDLDSMDFLNFVTALHERHAVDIPEADYPRLGSLNAIADYLAERIG